MGEIKSEGKSRQEFGPASPFVVVAAIVGALIEINKTHVLCTRYHICPILIPMILKENGKYLLC